MNLEQPPTIPVEIKRAVTGLDHDERWRIVDMLLRQGEIRYAVLQRALEIKKGSLTYHLDQLMLAGLVDNYSREKFQGPYESWYSLSRFGIDIINNLMATLEITPAIEPARQAKGTMDYQPVTVKTPEAETANSYFKINVKLKEITDYVSFILVTAPVIPNSATIPYADYKSPKKQITKHAVQQIIQERS